MHVSFSRGEKIPGDMSGGRRQGRESGDTACLYEQAASMQLRLRPFGALWGTLKDREGKKLGYLSITSCFSLVVSGSWRVLPSASSGLLYA